MNLVLYQRSLYFAVIAGVAGYAHATLNQGAGIFDPVGHRFSQSDGHNFKLKPTKDEDIVPRVTIPKLGTAKGRFLQSYRGNTFTAFHGIPYAPKPKRFQYSTVWDTDRWSRGEYDATYFRDKCAQKSLAVPIPMSGSEDCLFISVYSPLLNLSNAESEKLPVMVFIHGGAYLTGEADFYMPSKLIDQKVVVAVLQYRVGTLGFLYSGTVEAPGNMGLMDQINALRWTNKFISYFGGDPGLVTVFGQSAGGASTSWMQITPLTTAEHNNGVDLAHQFILMSGSALEYWTLEHDEENSFRLQANATNCLNYNTTGEMVGCMDNLTTEEIVSGSLKVYRDDRLKGGLGFVGQVPVVQTTLMEDPQSSGMEIVISEQPIDSVRAGRFMQVPTMMGSVRDEGSLVVSLVYNDFLVPWGYYNDSDYLINDMFPLVSQSFGIVDVTQAVCNSFRLAYMPEGLTLGNWDEMVGGLVDLGGTLFLKSGLWSLAGEMYAYNSSLPLYFYHFDFESDDSLYEWIFISNPDSPIVGGISHGDDMMYLFNLPCYFDDRESHMVHRMTTLYANFAKYGSPTPHVEGATEWSEWSADWLTYNAVDKPFMNLADNMTILYDFPLHWNYNKCGYSNVSLCVQQKDGVKSVSPKDSSFRVAAGAEGSTAAQHGLMVGVVMGVVAIAILMAAVAMVVMKNNSNSRQGTDNLSMVQR